MCQISLKGFGLESEVQPTSRLCLRPAIPEIQLAATYLDNAVSAHLAGNTQQAEDLIRAANIVAIRDWVESLWGKAYLQVRVIPDAPPVLSKEQREKLRMPTSAERRLLHARDGFHCRFCGIPLVRAEIRNLLRKLYPNALPWPNGNKEQHPAFQAMWAQYDHVLPHARGGGNDPRECRGHLRSMQFRSNELHVGRSRTGGPSNPRTYSVKLGRT